MKIVRLKRRYGWQVCIKGAKKATATEEKDAKRRAKKYLKLLAAWPEGHKSSKSPPSAPPPFWIVRHARRPRDASNSLWNVRNFAACRKGCWLIAGTVARRHSVHKFGQLGHSPSAVAWLASILILIPISIRIRNPVATSAVKAWQCSITAALQNFK